MELGCSGFTRQGKYVCTADPVWRVVKRDEQGRELTLKACGQHLNQITSFFVRDDDPSQPATCLEVKLVR